MPVTVTKLMIRMNQAERASMRNGTFPINEPRVNSSLNPWTFNAIRANNPEHIEIRTAETAVINPLYLSGEKIIPTHPAKINIRWIVKRTIGNPLLSKPIAQRIKFNAKERNYKGNFKLKETIVINLSLFLSL
jgi:hypothetical protein